jgi:hypothetical protein
MTKSVDVEVLSDDVNHIVLRYPTRKYPGSLIQGDTLYSMTSAIEHCMALLRKEEYEDLEIELNELFELLRGRLEHYKSTLLKQAIELPFDEPK